MELNLIQIYLYSIKIDSRCFRNPQPGASNSGNDQPPYIGKKPEAGPDWGVWALSTFLYSHNSGAFLDVHENKTNVNRFSQARLSPEVETCQTVSARMGPQTWDLRHVYFPSADRAEALQIHMDQQMVHPLPSLTVTTPTPTQAAAAWCSPVCRIAPVLIHQDWAEFPSRTTAFFLPLSLIHQWWNTLFHLSHWLGWITGPGSLALSPSSLISSVDSFR